MNASELEQILEEQIDQHGLATVLERIQHICFEKAEHIQVNWGDAPLVKQWATAANVVGTASAHPSVSGVSL